MPTDKDLLDDILEDAPVEDEPKFDSKAMEDLKSQLSELEKEKQGLLKGVKDERRKRQELKGRLDQVTETVNDILATRNDLATQELEKKTTEATVNGIPVEFTEDGDAFLPTEKINAITAPYEQEINDLKSQIEMISAAGDQRARAQKTMDMIVGKDESYGPAFNKYRTAREWVENKVVDFQRMNNIQGALSPGQALDHVFDSDLTQEFKSTFENIDLVDVVTAEESELLFERTLSNIAKAMTPNTDNQPDSRFQKVLQKPSGLGKSANAKGGEIPLSERAGNMQSTDIMNLTDDQIAALEKALRNEEETDGVNWK
jgi:hypothetical protein